MKILYLKLKNYSNIYTAFKSNEITIDLSKSKNNIILLTGENGSGKTSILSCLHPFSTNGNLDIRNENSLVLTGKEGYKEIHILNNDDIYIIKHYYTPAKESHITKSYIMKNDVELNINGNVTSFKELVKEELDIEMDYLKLTRLGSNVTNFIDLKTTERKSFMGKILEELDIYLKYHKKITTDMREVKSIISHTIDKLNKLNINKDTLESYQGKLHTKINNYLVNINNLQDKLSVVKNDIDKEDSIINIKENRDFVKKKLNKIYNKLDQNTDIKTVEDCNSIIEKLDKNVNDTNNRINVLNETYKTILNNIDNLLNERDSILKELKKISNNEELDNVKYMINKYKDKIEKHSKEYNLVNYNYTISKSELDSLIGQLKQNMDYLYSIYEFGKEPMIKAMDYVLNSNDISEYIKSNNIKKEKNKLQTACEIVYKHYGDIKVNDRKKCKAQDIYDDITDNALLEEDVIIEDETFVSSTKLAYQGIHNVIDNILKLKPLIDKLPDKLKDSLSIQNITSKILNLKVIYNIEDLYSELSLVTEYEIYMDNKEKLKELKTKRDYLIKNSVSTEYFDKRLVSISEELDNLYSDKKDTGNTITTLSNSLVKYYDELNSYKEIKEYLETKESLEADYTNYDNLYNKLKSLLSSEEVLTKELDSFKFTYNKMLEEYNLNEYNLNTYNELTDELNSYNKKYDDMELIKNSLSSKEGIPLLYIQIYLKNIQEVTNELLNIVYDDSLYIDDFNITADEFKIPYITKNTIIKDIAYASQGEKSFISLALSFALIYQSISKYNIMLLDEIDSTLDTSNREKFLHILEKQLDMIGAEQIFLISHNNMFNMYPVDVIDTKNIINKEYNLANYIQIQY